MVNSLVDFDIKGDGDSQFLHAHNIAVDSQGNI